MRESFFMCGITGIVAFNEKTKNSFQSLDRAIEALKSRGPDNNGTFAHNNCALGHTRLSIIDTSEAASQPFSSADGRYTIVFNGEFYNFKEHREILKSKGVQFRSNSDTEVLLYLYIHFGADFLKKINGCFALAIYDKHEESLLLARDRMGINPLLIYQDDEKLAFASEMKALLSLDIKKNIDYSSLHAYLHLNYVPGQQTILSHVSRLKPGSYWIIQKGKIKKETYYAIPQANKNYSSNISYLDAKSTLKEILSKAVERRMVSDVPLGAFLSGGIDSSVIVSIASQLTNKLKTFSIGYKDEPYFDETKYANLVAKQFGTDHTAFSLSNNDLYDILFDVLNYTDEPFADSSALAVYLLSKHTRKHVTVALSGDGADELFSGYNKHYAEYLVRQKGAFNQLVKLGHPLWKCMPKSRNNKITDKFRQLYRFSSGMKLSEKERYWRWAGFTEKNDADQLLKLTADKDIIASRKQEILKYISRDEGINDILLTDLNLVLQNDMLTKVDLMSMANSLEVRVPFLDHEVVNFVNQLPSTYKIDRSLRKKLLQDAYRDILPAQLYNRPKHGFEVPLLKWLRTDLQSLINKELLSKDFIIAQNIFNYEAVEKLKKKLFSSNPEDAHARIWGLLVFQFWWRKYLA